MLCDSLLTFILCVRVHSHVREHIMGLEEDIAISLYSLETGTSLTGLWPFLLGELAKELPGSTYLWPQEHWGLQAHTTCFVWMLHIQAHILRLHS